MMRWHDVLQPKEWKRSWLLFCQEWFGDPQRCEDHDGLRVRELVIGGLVVGSLPFGNLPFGGRVSLRCFGRFLRFRLLGSYASNLLRRSGR